MKTTHFLFLLGMITIFSISKVQSQTNAVYPANSSPNGANVSIGYGANTFDQVGNTYPMYNTFVGTQAGATTISDGIELSNAGSSNTFIGYQSGRGNKYGRNNIGLGSASLQNYGCTDCANFHNIGIGANAGAQLRSNYNILIGRNCGNNLVTGGGNTFIGQVDVPNSLSADTDITVGTNSFNTVIIGTGSGTQRIFIHNNGYTGIGLGNNVIPKNRLEIKSLFTNHATKSSGLRLTNLKNTITPVTNQSNGVLSVNSDGDVILVYDQVGSGSGGSTIIQAGTNVDITGSGTLANPYNISACNLYTCDGTLTGNRLVNMDNNNLIFNTGGNTTTEEGRIYIGNTTDFTTGLGTNFPTFFDGNPVNTRDYRLYVEGGLLTERVKVALRSTANWADYVFNKDYKLMPLNEVEAFIKQNNHLPEILSASDIVKNGLDVADMQAKQMAKIEELTLYAIEQNKQLEKQSKEIEELKTQVKALLEKK